MYVGCRANQICLLQTHPKPSLTIYHPFWVGTRPSMVKIKSLSFLFLGKWDRAKALIYIEIGLLDLVLSAGI